MIDPINIIRLRKQLKKYDRRDIYFTSFRTCRPVKNITTGEIFSSLKQAADAYGVSSASLRAAVNKPTRTCVHCKWIGVDSSNEEIDYTSW